MPKQQTNQFSNSNSATENQTDYAALDIDVALSALSSTQHGLTANEAQTRLQQHGPNRLPDAKPKPAWQRLAEQFANVLIHILLICGVISLLMGHWVDGGVIFGVVVINALVGFIQEGKAEAALRSILSMTETRCLVVRNGEQISIDSADLVPGDIVSLQAGDKIPADLRLIFNRDLRCDESALTGESQPVSKYLEAVQAQAISDRSNMAFMGTLVTYGVARGVVCNTGLSTEIGKISTLVEQAELPETPLQKQLTRFAKYLSIIILVISLLSVLFGTVFRDYSFAEMFQAAIGIAVAAIPEGLPAVVTIALAIGVQLMAGKRALVRRLPSVEVLGSVDVICTDKTGTLTANAMTARHLVMADQAFTLQGEGYSPQGSFTDRDTQRRYTLGEDPQVDRACLIAMLCNDANITEDNGEWQLHGDPTEGALSVMAMKYGLSQKQTRHQWPRIDELPFETERRYMATYHHDSQGQRLLAIKGAPDRILSFSTHQLTDRGEQPLDLAHWQSVLETMSSQGMRVMALAQKQLTTSEVTLSHEMAESGLTLIALVGISDPPRAEVISSIEECHQAGIRVKMITGDSPITAQAIGRELGLAADRVITGSELDQLDARDWPSVVNDVDIFARASPANKLQLVDVLRKNNHVVAMTGDGVNDAPALRQANIGVAMGKKGTDAAKEAADIVLTDDNFHTITEAVRQGRTVYDNIVKSILFIMPTSLAEALVILVAIMAGMMLPITPAQILWVNMITAITLALALGFENTEAGTMKRPPRSMSQGLITPTLLIRLLLVGGAAAGIVFWQFTHYLAAGESLEMARTVAVNTLVVLEAVYLINCRFLSQSIFSRATFNGAFPIVLAILVVMLLQIIYTYLPISQKLFGLVDIGWIDWLQIILVALPLLLVVEVQKIIANKITTVKSL